MSILVDSNVVIDVMHGAGEWSRWSERTMLQAATTGSLTINQIVFAEIAAYFTDGGRFNKIASGLGLVREDLPWDAAREAGLAHAAYRLAGGMRERVLADFLIGAHASTRSHVLLTRDARRYRTYFPNLDIIAPDSHP